MAPLKNMNHSTSRDYELIIHKLISQEMTGLKDVELIEIKHNHTMEGLSGYVHQIDVSFRFRVWKLELLVLVECKQYKSKVGVDDLLEFRSRIDDLKAHKGLFVTTNGFQSGAVEYANANNIALLVVKGTRHSNVLYSYDRRPSLERCKNQIDDLITIYGNNYSHALQSRLSIDEERNLVLVKNDGITLELEPGELHCSLLYRKECEFTNREGDNFFFNTEKTKYIMPDKLLKWIIIQEVLTMGKDNQNRSVNCTTEAWDYPRDSH